MTIANKTILVTGANRGIGQALVTEALRRGAKRVYAGTRQPLTHPDDRVTPLRLDVTDAGQIQAAADQVEALDILINNAGIWLFDDLSDGAAIEEHLAVNFYGAWGRGARASSARRGLAPGSERRDVQPARRVAQAQLVAQVPDDEPRRRLQVGKPGE
jgi:NAD(P)-dependent dehydrogenase (short-subunit alcohol dehydrogenase family)